MDAPLSSVDGELASVMNRFPRADYDQMHDETVKRFGKPARTVTEPFSGLDGKYGRQRRAEWRYPGTISVTLADGSAANGNTVSPGFLLLQSDERAYSGLK
jgi:hypothetical protein